MSVSRRKRTLSSYPKCRLTWTRSVKKSRHGEQRGRETSIIALSEGAGNSEEITEYIKEHTGRDMKRVVLGYTQRGGEPTVFDPHFGHEDGRSGG